MECGPVYVYVYTYMFQINLLLQSSMQIYHDYRDRKSLWYTTTYPPNYIVFNSSHCHVYKTSNLKSHGNINQEQKHTSKVIKIVSFTEQRLQLCTHMHGNNELISGQNKYSESVKNYHPNG